MICTVNGVERGGVGMVGSSVESSQNCAPCRHHREITHNVVALSLKPYPVFRTRSTINALSAKKVRFAEWFESLQIV